MYGVATMPDTKTANAAAANGAPSAGTLSAGALGAGPLAAGAWGARGTAGPVFAGQLDFDDVSYSVRGKGILHNITLRLEAGKISCLLGPSGCGKTTLLRLAAGVAQPSSGRLLIDGKVVAGPGTFVPPERRSVGLMFQDFALFPHMTALENVAYGLYALQREEARGVAEMALARVGLSSVAQRYPAMLSGGEQQRVALARAIVPRPQVILMDEPFSGLDQRLRESVRSETLGVLRETRATCLLVTHDPQEAVEFADEIFLMRQGRLVQHGAPDALLRQPVDAAAARFFQSFNEFHGIVSHGALDTPFGRIAAPGLADGTRAIAMVAPASITVTAGGHGIAARVLQNRFLGMQRRLQLHVSGVEQPVDALVAPNITLLKGDDCSLALVGPAPQVFAADVDL